MTNWILGDKFHAVYPHKNSIKGLWESKWKFAVCKQITQQIHTNISMDADFYTVLKVHLSFPRWLN